MADEAGAVRASDAISAIQFSVLGPLEVRGPRGRFEIGGAKQRLVLAHLIVAANRVVSADRLIDDVWGDEPPDAARSSLQAYVSRLRRALAATATIDGRPPGYVLIVDEAKIDANRFAFLLDEARRLRTTRPEAALELLGEALALWRGAAFDDLADEPSLQPEIARLEDVRLVAVEDRLELELGQGRARDAVAELERLVREHPLRERMWALLMVALYRSGRQADALAAYLRARTILSDELGVEPSPELQRLQAQILAHDPALRGGVGSLRGYELLERIGAGASGVVYRAVQPRVGREVAIKAIHAHLAQEPEFIRRFEAEAQIVARLEHPGIVPLYDYWRGPDGAFLVLRWMRGGSLRETLEARRADRDAATRIVTQVAAALAAAHRSGVVHGDVSTSNVLLDDNGDAYLADFGVAAVVADASGAAGVGLHPAPERASGERASPLSDQYGLGIVIRELVGETSGEVRAVIERATAGDPPARYPDVEALAEAFARAAGEAPPSVSEALANPYKGLRSFEEPDRDDFFGRASLVDELVANLATPGCRFLAVVGASGSGKSSVVDAGLVPALRGGAVPGSERWFVADMHPGGSPFRELDEALLRVAADSPPTFMDTVTAGPRGLLRAVEAALAERDSELLLVIDQLEELFTLVVEAEVRNAFLDALVTAVTDRNSRLRVVATLRADFFDRPLAHRGMAELLRDATQAMVPLGADELADTVRLPAARAGVDVEPDLVAAMVADVVDQPGALPLLQYALTEVFERRSDGPMTLAAYRALGGIGGAVARRADELYAGLDTRGREAARQLFLRLVTLGEGVEDTRRRVPMGEVQAMEVDQAAMSGVIEAFGRHRLLSFDRDPATREPTVEVAHEALLRAWARLRRWVEEGREDLRMHRHLAVAAADWEASGRDPSDLWRGARLEQAEAWAASGAVALTDAERAFMQASTTARDAEAAAAAERHRHDLELERRSSNRLRALAIVLAAAAFGTAALSGVVLVQAQTAEREARAAAAGELAAQALNLIAVDPDLAIHLAMQAVEATRDDGVVVREAEEALHAAVLGTRVVERSAPREGVVLSSDWTYEAHPDPAGIRIVRADDGQTVAIIAVEGPVSTVAVSADQRWVTVTSGTDWPELWAVSNGTAVPGWATDGIGPVTSAAFSPDGRWLAASSIGTPVNPDEPPPGEVRVWEVPSGAEVFRTPTTGDSGGGHGVAWSPDSARLAIVRGGTDTVIFDASADFAEAMVLSRPDPNSLSRSVAYSPGGDHILVTGISAATLWDGETGAMLHDLPGHVGWVFAYAFSADGGLVATSAGDGIVRVWDVAGGTEVSSIPGAQGIVQALRFSSDGTRLHATGGDGRVVLDITPAGSRELWSGLNNGFAMDLRFSRDGERLASTGVGEVVVWDTSAGRRLAENTSYEAMVFDVEFSPDGSLLASAARDGSVHLLSAAGERVVKLAGHDRAAWSVGFSPDGTRLLSAGEDGSARIWDVETGAELARFEVQDVAFWDAIWSPDGALVATVSSDGVGRLWDAETETEIRALHGHRDNVIQAAFSPDGSRLATGGFDGAAIVWDVATGEQVFTLPYPGTVIDVGILPDGSHWVVSGLDGTVRLFDSATGRETLAIPVGAEAGRIAVHPNGRLIAVANAPLPGVLNLITLDVEELLEIARERVTRPMTDRECRQYLGLEACPDAA